MSNYMDNDMEEAQEAPSDAAKQPLPSPISTAKIDPAAPAPVSTPGPAATVHTAAAETPYGELVHGKAPESPASSRILSQQARSPFSFSPTNLIDPTGPAVVSSGVVSHHGSFTPGFQEALRTLQQQQRQQQLSPAANGDHGQRPVFSLRSIPGGAPCGGYSDAAVGASFDFGGRVGNGVGVGVGLGDGIGFGSGSDGGDGAGAGSYNLRSSVGINGVGNGCHGGVGGGKGAIGSVGSAGGPPADNQLDPDWVKDFIEGDERYFGPHGGGHGGLQPLTPLGAFGSVCTEEPFSRIAFLTDYDVLYTMPNPYSKPGNIEKHAVSGNSCNI